VLRAAKVLAMWAAVCVISGLTKEAQGAVDRGSDDCVGIVPDGLPESRSAAIPRYEGQFCGSVTVDGQGNVAGGSGYPGGNFARWTMFSTAGDQLGQVDAHLALMPQESGFQGMYTVLDDPWSDRIWIHAAWDPSGRRRTENGLGSDMYCRFQLQRNLAGGSQALMACTSSGNLSVRRFDAEGHPLSYWIPVSDRSNGVTGAIDLNGLTLLVFLDATMFGFGPDDYAARWYDESGNPITDYFPLFTGPGDHQSSNAIARPLIGGGVAVQIRGEWVAVSPSGAAVSLPPPEWLASHSNYDSEIVRGGRAYALIPKWPVEDRNTVPLYSASGNHCGDVTFPLPNVTVGIDGTAISSSGDGLCTMTWWPQVLP